MPSPAVLEVDGINHSYGRDVILKEISFRAREGDVLCLLGPSGCGKTSLLRILAGLIAQRNGRVIINGKDQAQVRTQQRNIGYVFQDLALFPHMTVRDNVAFPFMHGGRPVPDGGDARSAVNEILATTDLDSISHRGIANLSGGQLQRVALARALVYRPTILLLDEPLSSLDNPRKSQLLSLLVKLQQRYQSTIVYVTHDEREARQLGTHFAVIGSDHSMHQFGSIDEVTASPATTEVARLVGGWNVIPVKCVGQPPGLELGAGITLPLAGSRPATAETVRYVGLPMRFLRVVLPDAQVPSGALAIPVVLLRSSPWLNGWRYLCTVGHKPDPRSPELVCFHTDGPPLPSHTPFTLAIHARECHVFNC